MSVQLGENTFCFVITKMNVLIILLLRLCFAATRINSEPIAHIGDTEIVGQRLQYSDLEVNQFLGVPYAEPPIMHLRFHKTKPISCYPKTIRAFHPPPACHQFSTKPYPYYINTTTSEDCLYLNIWTPTDASPHNTKAVMYWIHGGHYRFGSNTLFPGTALASVGDIVVVTVNYRLGPIGFLTSGTKEAPGNAGLWDILEGLKWVNQNILAFGGDPTRVTIAGESVGSTAVALLSVSPLSQGLYARQIMESGSSANLAYENTTYNLNMTQRLSTVVGCASDTYTIYDHPTEVTACLKEMDADKLTEVDEQLNTELALTFIPQYGDDLLPENPRLALANGEIHNKDVLTGVNHDEGSLGLTKEIFQHSVR